jgi:hypothetical protein
MTFLGKIYKENIKAMQTIFQKKLLNIFSVKKGKLFNTFSEKSLKKNFQKSCSCLREREKAISITF